MNNENKLCLSPELDSRFSIMFCFQAQCCSQPLFSVAPPKNNVAADLLLLFDTLGGFLISTFLSTLVPFPGIVSFPFILNSHFYPPGERLTNVL